MVEGDFVRRRVQRRFEGESRTEQSHKKKCDVNAKVRRYMKTGLIEQQRDGAMYGDFTSAEDFQTSLHRVNDALRDMSLLPAVVRKRFKNDPGRLIEFLNDPKNRDEAVQLGLVAKVVVEEVAERSGLDAASGEPEGEPVAEAS